MQRRAGSLATLCCSKARFQSAYPSSQLKRRNLWTTRTIVSSDAEALLQDLPSTFDVRAGNPTLYTLSRNIPASVLSQLVKHFQALPTKAIGSLSYGSEDGTGPFTISYAVHQAPQNRLELVVPFRSEISGTPQISLGREVKQSVDSSTERLDWSEDSAEDLPVELQLLDPNLVNQVIYFSDQQPQGLMKSLEAKLPNATKLGLLASSTPFATGRPHTLLYGQEVYSTGAVGVAICRSPSFFNHALDIRYDGLVPLGGPVEVTHSRGNIILELASSNATRLLLERIQKDIGMVIDKDQGFYLGILPPGKNTANVQDMTSVRPIIAGDPSRGALSLDTEANIVPGQMVQFFHSTVGGTGVTLDTRTSDTSSMIVFGKEDGIASSRCSTPGVYQAFSSMSEHGFIVGRPDEASWICSVGDSQASVKV